MTEKEIYEVLRCRRKAMGLTQAQLAEKTGLSRNCISMIEKGIYTPRFSGLLKIFEVLDLSMEVHSSDVIYRVVSATEDEQSEILDSLI